MTAMESFLLGIMVSWTPSLIVLAWLLWNSEELESHSDYADY